VEQDESDNDEELCKNR